MRSHPNFAQTKNLAKPNQYVEMLQNEFKAWVVLEDIAAEFRGRWRNVFATAMGQPADALKLDLEIGTGNGFHFAYRAQQEPLRALLGMELKYKPIVQSIRRAVKAGCNNARMLRFHAGCLEQLFSLQELNNVFIHFPDPWSRSKQAKHRLMNAEFLTTLWERQRAMKNIERSPYSITSLSYNWHHSGEWQAAAPADRFITHFETIFLRQGLPIHRATLRKSVL